MERSPTRRNLRMSDFNAWCASALWTLLEVSVQATLCLGIVLMLRRALGKLLRPDWRYALWGVLMLRMLLPFSFDAPAPWFTVSLPEPGSPAQIATQATPMKQSIDVPSGSAEASVDAAPVAAT